MNTLYFVFMVIEAVVILFELRALMQSSSVDYYHKVTQAVVRLTEPLIRVIPFRNKSIGGFYFTGVNIWRQLPRSCRTFFPAENILECEQSTDAQRNIWRYSYV